MGVPTSIPPICTYALRLARTFSMKIALKQPIEPKFASARGAAPHPAGALPQTP